MPYRDIALVSIYGLHGTLYVQKAEKPKGFQSRLRDMRSRW